MQTTSTAAHSLHNPERHPLESQADYRARRAASQREVAAVLRGVRVSVNKDGKPPSSTDRERARVAALRPVPPQPKARRERSRKQYEHPLRDAHGAYTLTGSTYEIEGMEPTEGEHVTQAWHDPRDGSFGYVARHKWLGIGRSAA